MSYELSEKTKKQISGHHGIPYEQLINMDWDEIEEQIYKKTGKKITWTKDIKIGGLKPLTIEETEDKLEKIVDEWER